MIANMVILLGRVVKTPELRFTSMNKAVVTLWIVQTWARKAEGVRWARSGVKGDFSWRRAWLPVTLFDELASWASRAFKPKTVIWVSGYLKLDRWKGPDGTSRSRMSVVGRNIQIVALPPKKKGGNYDRGDGVVGGGVGSAGVSSLAPHGRLEASQLVDEMENAGATQGPLAPAATEGGGSDEGLGGELGSDFSAEGFDQGGAAEGPEVEEEGDGA